MLKRVCVVFIFCFFAWPSHAVQTYVDIIKTANLTEVANTIEQAQIDGVIPLHLRKNWSIEHSQSVVLLKALDCLNIDDVLSVLANKLTSNCTWLEPLKIKHFDISEVIKSSLNGLLTEGIVEGYNIKHTALVSHFDASSDVLLYGHQSLIHAKQLLTLLIVHNVKFSWAILPKTSAFKIRAGWQDMAASEISERIRYAQEFDLKITFINHHEKMKFMPLINQFAKRDSQHQQGLIVEAWWQPFYRSFITERDYQHVKRISLEKGDFFASTLVLNENYAAVKKQIKMHLNSSSQAFVINSENVWVNPAFYRYLHGKHQ